MNQHKQIFFSFFWIKNQIQKLIFSLQDLLNFCIAVFAIDGGV